MKKVFAVLVALGLALGAGAAAYAQVYTGSIVGRVVDQTGSVLPGVTVTITSNKLLQPENSVTSETGAYRFAELPVGTYTITFELSGFKKLVRENIILTAGSTQTINVEMALAGVEETVTVSSESPVVDVRNTGLPASFSNERLESIPTSRDPWVILQQTPGIVVDRQNVGGTESGQQSNWSTRGTDFSQNMWNYDGVNITDMAAAGASPMYYDFGAFEEINISTGGEEANAQTAGTHLNFVVKQGTNQWKGQVAFYGTNDNLQSDNINDTLRAEGAGAGAPIKRILDYGADFGGPILQDRAWVWGDYGVQDISIGTLGFIKPGCGDPESADCLEPDKTKLKNNNIKVNVQLASNNKFNFLWARNDKTKGTRGADPLRPLETTWKQSGPTNIFKFEDTHVVNPNLLFTGRFAYVSGGFALDYQESALRTEQAAFDLSTGGFSRSFLDFQTDRPQYVANFDGNYFLSNALGGDHEFKFGFQYKHATIDSFTTYGGDVWAVFDGAEAVEAWLFRPGAVSYQGDFAGLHVQDVFTKERMTLKLALRYDYQTGKSTASQIPAHLLVPDLMPSLTFSGTESVDAWNNFSPRIGFTYDISGDGRTIAKANYGRYYDLLRLDYHAAWENAAGVSEIDLPWTDLNGDRFVQANELDTSTILFTSNFDPANPASVTSPDKRDPDTTAPTTDEFIVGLEREVVPDFSVGASYIYKRFTNLLWEEWPYSGSSGRSGLSGQQFPFVDVPTGGQAFVPVNSEFDGRSITYYEMAPGFSKTGNYLTNRDGYKQTYQGIEITGRKRLSNRWMMNVGFTWNTGSEDFDGRSGIFDPTNVDIRDGQEVAPYTGGSGKTRIFMNSNWIFRLDGMVQLPAGVNVAGKLNGRQGFPLIRTYRTPTRAGGIGRTEVILDSVGQTRLGDLWVADLRVEKSFRWGRGDISGMLDIFNLFNEATVLKREQRQNQTTSDSIQEILPPRVFRFGVRVRF